MVKARCESELDENHSLAARLKVEVGLAGIHRYMDNI